MPTKEGGLPQFSEIVVRHRKRLVLTLQQYGEVYGVTRQAVWKWEHGLAEVPERVISEAIVSWYDQGKERHGRK